ncbi:hypothetical protein FACS1894105_08490 [Clostridia bacterium]|nr:hypothetical protein FACS1894105_08490 [Clostridia bacterium]
MSKYCFGAFAVALKGCLPKKGKCYLTPQKIIISVLLMSINEKYDMSTDDDEISHLLSCDSNLSNEIRIPAQSADGKTISEYFQTKIIPMLDPNKRKIAILVIRDIILNDDDIDDDTIVDKISGTTKKALRNQSEFCFADFLTGCFLYTVTDVDNTAGKQYVKQITDDYINSFAHKTETIMFAEHIPHEEQSDEPSAVRGEPYTEEPSAPPNTQFVFNQQGNNNIQVGAIEALTINN